MPKPTLFYVHDPMCSWCYGFDKTRKQLFDQVRDKVEIKRLVGGLAPDSDEPMPEEMRTFLQGAWRKIEDRIPGVNFNFDFWEKCQPRRSTYPSCRAVLTAKSFGDEHDPLMTSAIQKAYYQDARNPSNHDTLIQLADEIGLNRAEFTDRFHSPEIEAQLQADIRNSRAMGLDSFPSLMLQPDRDSSHHIPIRYNSAEAMYAEIEKGLGNNA